VLAATNKDLRAEVQAGRFRDDLFYRLNVVPLRMPPLRDRLDDIPELVTYFLTRHHERTGAPLPVVTSEAITTLRRYAWPGNVRELANICERMAILHPGLPITEREVRRMIPDLDAAVETDERALHERLDDYEKDLILRALSEANDNVADAARRLQTDRPNLYRRMRRLGIDR
jgi:two-component system nitrogen regulation response regulator NtrX